MIKYGRLTPRNGIGLALTFNEELAELVNGDLDAAVDKLSEVQKDVRKRAR